MILYYLKKGTSLWSEQPSEGSTKVLIFPLFDPVQTREFQIKKQDHNKLLILVYIVYRVKSRWDMGTKYSSVFEHSPPHLLKSAK